MSSRYMQTINDHSIHHCYVTKLQCLPAQDCKPANALMCVGVIFQKTSLPKFNKCKDYKSEQTFSAIFSYIALESYQ